MRIHMPASVIQAIIRAANNGDVPGMMRFFAEEAVLSLKPELPAMRAIHHGRDEINEYVQRIVQGGFHVEADEISTIGDDVTWRSRVSGGLFRQAGIDQAEVSSRAFVQDGRIQAIDIHYAPETVRQLEAGLLEHA